MNCTKTVQRSEIENQKSEMKKGAPAGSWQRDRICSGVTTVESQRKSGGRGAVPGSRSPSRSAAGFLGGPRQSAAAVVHISASPSSDARLLHHKTASLRPLQLVGQEAEAVVAASQALYRPVACDASPPADALAGENRRRARPSRNNAYRECHSAPPRRYFRIRPRRTPRLMRSIGPSALSSFGVSRIIGRFRKRTSLISSRNGSRPRQPRPM